MTETGAPVATTPVLELLESAWGIIANAGWDGEGKSPGWQEAAERWREEYHAFLKGVDANIAQPDPEPQLPEGEYATVEIMGHDSETGWVSDGTRAGVPVMVVRDHDGRVIREIPGHAMFSYIPLPTPLRRPEPRALPAGLAEADTEPDDLYDIGEPDADDDRDYPDSGLERQPF